MNTKTDEALRLSLKAMQLAYSANYQQETASKLEDAILKVEEALAQPQPRMFLDLSNSNGNHPVEQQYRNEPEALRAFHNAKVIRVESGVDIVATWDGKQEKCDIVIKPIVQEAQQVNWEQELREWNEATGALPKNGSWFWEVASMLERASNTAPAIVQEPKGWKLVPIELTDKMLDAADADGDCHYIATQWEMMLKAAPQPPARELVGLTDEERQEILERIYEADGENTYIDPNIAMREAEQSLKEKNA